MLFCVNTEPIENAPERLDLLTTDNEHSDPSAMSGDRNCFICHSSDSTLFLDLYTTITKHSRTSIYNFVWKLLGGQPSARNDSIDASCLKEDVVCADCLDIINEYDKARLNVKRYKKHLREKLIQTEAYFQSLQNDESGKTATDVAIDDDDVLEL